MVGISGYLFRSNNQDYDFIFQFSINSHLLFGDPEVVGGHFPTTYLSSTSWAPRGLKGLVAVASMRNKEQIHNTHTTNISQTEDKHMTNIEQIYNKQKTNIWKTKKNYMANKEQIYDKQRTNIWETKTKYMTNKRQIYL